MVERDRFVLKHKSDGRIIIHTMEGGECLSDSYNIVDVFAEFLTGCGFHQGSVFDAMESWVIEHKSTWERKGE